jgi:hypothetical protein
LLSARAVFFNLAANNNITMKKVIIILSAVAFFIISCGHTEKNSGTYYIR